MEADFLCHSLPRMLKMKMSSLWSGVGAGTGGKIGEAARAGSSELYRGIRVASE